MAHSLASGFPHHNDDLHVTQYPWDVSVVCNWQLVAILQDLLKLLVAFVEKVIQLGLKNVTCRRRGYHNL
eukprot:2574030-Ditylum_brightwellii.AAC.1